MKGENNKYFMAKEEDNLFIKVLEERDQMLNFFDTLIADNNAFEVFFATCSDEELINFYYYLVRTNKILEYKNGYGEETPTLKRMHELLARLEKYPTIKDHIESQINDTVRLVESRKKNRSLIRRLFSKKNN